MDPCLEQWERWERREDWLVAFCWLLIGAIAGIHGLAAFVEPLLGTPELVLKSTPVAMARPGDREEALVLNALRTAPDSAAGYVQVSWLVVNRGVTTWSVDLYRFVPERSGDPVIHLPRTVPPGREALVRAVLPPESDPFDLRRERVWHLTGPLGRVPGGQVRPRLDAGPPGGESFQPRFPKAGEWFAAWRK